MKVKIEDFLLAMGDYCREHSPEECASCKMSVDHEDPGDGTVFYGCAMFGCEYPKYAKKVKKEILKYMKERKKEKRIERFFLERKKLTVENGLRDMWFKDMVHGLYMTLKMQIRADRMAISLIRIRSVNTPDLQTRREGRYGRTTLLNTIMVIIMLL